MNAIIRHTLGADTVIGTPFYRFFVAAVPGFTFSKPAVIFISGIVRLP
jgi:hypothetical protein